MNAEEAWHLWVTRSSTPDQKEECFRLIYPRLLECARGYARAFAPRLKEHDREDIVSKAVSQMYFLQDDRAQSTDAAFRSLLKMVVRSRVIDFVRMDRVRQDGEVRLDVAKLIEPIREAFSLEADVTDQLYLAFKRLDSEDQHLLTMRFVERLTYKEAADRLRVSITAVRQRVQRALRRLRKFFIDLDGSGLP